VLELRIMPATACTPQVLAKACGGVHKVPDILGGGLDTQRARTEWLAKMDEVLAAAAAAAKVGAVTLMLCTLLQLRSSLANQPNMPAGSSKAWAIFSLARYSCGGKLQHHPMAVAACGWTPAFNLLLQPCVPCVAVQQDPNPQLTVSCGPLNRGNSTAAGDEDFATPMSAMSR
jgi:hypothetical protein